MSQLGDLYQELIIDHSKRPRNRGPLPGANRMAEGHNRLCGDRVTVFVELDGEVLRTVRFEGKGCAISTASASLLTEAVQGKTRAQVEALYHRFHELVTGQPDEQAQANEAAGQEVDLGKLSVFQGVCEYPARVKCASLAWHTLHSALEAGEGQSGTVTTE